MLAGALALSLGAACNDDHGTRSVSGLFSEPRETTVDRTVTLTPPNVTFAPWDGRSTMLYSINNGTEQNLGPGSSGRFSTDGTRMVWRAGEDVSSAAMNFSGEARVLDLETNEVRILGPATIARFNDDATVWLVRPDPPNITFEVDLASGNERVLGEILSDLWGPETSTEHYELSYVDDALTAVVREVATGADVLQISLVRGAGRGWTHAVTFAGDARLLVVTALVKEDPVDHHGYRNIFLVDIQSGSATFVATATGYGATLPATANERYVVWADNYCGAAKRAYVYDIDGRTITGIDADLYPFAFTQAGLLISGELGGRQLVDLNEFVVRVELPGGEAAWSDNGLYASIGQMGAGRGGGVCP